MALAGNIDDSSRMTKKKLEYRDTYASKVLYVMMMGVSGSCFEFFLFSWYHQLSEDKKKI